MVTIEQAIEALNQCEFLKADRFTPEMIEREEQDPSSIATPGEIIILLNALKDLWENQDKSWKESSVHKQYQLEKNGGEYKLLDKDGNLLDMFFHYE
jgi:hypothetical protein